MQGDTFNGNVCFFLEAVNNVCGGGGGGLIEKDSRLTNYQESLFTYDV